MMIPIVGIILGQVLDCLAQHSYNSLTGMPSIEEQKAVAKLSNEALIALSDYLNGCDSRPNTNSM